jgi:hypothetical protein
VIGRAAGRSVKKFGVWPPMPAGAWVPIQYGDLYRSTVNDVDSPSAVAHTRIRCRSVIAMFASLKRSPARGQVLR